jgi:pSer/pThr/pTyr-binding forkhead associated (FHA) protein
MESLNRRDLTVKALAGLAGGAVGWLPVEIVSHNHSLFEPPTTAGVVENFVAMALLAGLIGGAIVASDAQKLEITPHLKRRFLIGFVICLVLSIPANYYANLVFSYILVASGATTNQVSIPALIAARVVGWTLLGLMLGAGVGGATFSLPNVLKGAAGGWVGGFVGGLAFDVISAGTGGTISRLIGFSAIGLAIGLFIGLVQELTKAAWVKVEAGRLQGREYRLERPVSFLGRAEECEVGLFGDPDVLGQHSRIERSGANFVLKDLSHREGTFLNGNRTESAELHEGDRIKLGNYELSFHLRKRPGLAFSSAAPREPFRPAQVTDANGPHLADAQGHRFGLKTGGVTRLGRALDNDVVLDHNSISRHHASIAQQNGTFLVKDLGSQNGTYVDGKRVQEVTLTDGDSIRLGDAQFVFRA